MPTIRKLFISHSSMDDPFVRALRTALADHGQQGWIDSRELRGGDPLWSVIQKAIEDADAFAVVVSPDALQSEWVSDELAHAVALQKDRGREAFPVIPLLLDNARLGAFRNLIGEQPLHIPVSSQPGGVDAAVEPILVALGIRLPTERPAMPQPAPEPLEELVLELTDLRFDDQDGVRRASARARLVYDPALAGQDDVHSDQPWRLFAPLIEADELRWYLEKYAVWPSHYFRERARKVEENLVSWGRQLHDAAMPVAHTANVMRAWAKISDSAGRRFSVHVDPALEAGASESDLAAAREVATLLLGLPWELLHDGEGYLFQGAAPTRVRRRLPSTRARSIPVVDPPIRILLVTARPEDEACGFIDHRASALPLVEAMEALPGLVHIHVLSPPTLPALREELDRARAVKQPYHVVHFDGHGVYDRNVGLGGLCFELPEDIGKLDGRRHKTVYTSEIGPLLRDHRIPLVFLEACQTAQAEQASESVASELLKVGVASVVAMSHSVLVETASRFVEAFYDALADGKRVGDAMLAGQRRLKDDTFRGRIFGAGELRLEDWFVPVLFQEKEDPQLFTTTPARQTQEGFQVALARRLGDLPAVPETGFIGRSRELLVLQRLLRADGGARYAVVRGQGGEGKTTLAAEFGRWMVRSHQVRRAAFVSVEGLEKNIAESVLDALGRQLVKPGFSTQADCNGDVEKAAQEVERALREQPTLLVLDNMESILPPPFVEEETPDALSEEMREELATVLDLCQRLVKSGDTRLVFTSREALPPPFEGERQRLELHRLSREDAVKMVERVLNAAGGDAGASSDAAREEIEGLVDDVHGHARTLALLAPSLRSRGVEATRQSLVELMAEMERRFPGSREHSVFASVELSLRRLSAPNRERVRALGVFHGSVDLDVLRSMMQWEEAQVAALAEELVVTGLATPNQYSHLTLNPALCPYLARMLGPDEAQALMVRWVPAMRGYAGYLTYQRSLNVAIAATLTTLELPNLFALLAAVQRAGDAEATIDVATLLHALLQELGKPRLLKRVGAVRDEAAATLGDTWNHALFQAWRTRIEQLLSDGRLSDAWDGARHLLRRVRTAGEQAYAGAGYDLAAACFLLAQVTRIFGGPEQALLLVEEARQRFEAMEGEQAAERMAAKCFSEQGDCLTALGRLEEAATAYLEGIRRSESLGDERAVAVGKAQVGSVRVQQRRYPEALAAYAEARERFTTLDEPGAVAVSWHQTGLAHENAGEPEAAEDAYRRSLAIKARIGDVAGQARTLVQLANLYKSHFNRVEEAAGLYADAVSRFVELRDEASEAKARSGLALALMGRGRFAEAREEIRRALKHADTFGHVLAPWKFWGILADLETEAGNTAAATEARVQATRCFLAYRRDNGENHDGPGRLALQTAELLRGGRGAEAATLLRDLAGHPEAMGPIRTFINALQAIVAGSRDRSLADAPDLAYTMAAEILFLIETL